MRPEQQRSEGADCRDVFPSFAGECAAFCRDAAAGGDTVVELSSWLMSLTPLAGCIRLSRCFSPPFQIKTPARPRRPLQSFLYCSLTGSRVVMADPDKITHFKHAVLLHAAAAHLLSRSCSVQSFLFEDPTYHPSAFCSSHQLMSHNHAGI